MQLVWDSCGILGYLINWAVLKDHGIYPTQDSYREFVFLYSSNYITDKDEKEKMESGLEYLKEQNNPIICLDDFVHPSGLDTPNLIRAIKMVGKDHLPTHVSSDHQQRVRLAMMRSNQETPNHPEEPSEKLRLKLAAMRLSAAIDEIKALGVGVKFKEDYTNLSDMIEDYTFGIEDVFDMTEVVENVVKNSVVGQKVLVSCGVADIDVIEEIDNANLLMYYKPNCKCGTKYDDLLMATPARGEATCPDCDESFPVAHINELGLWTKPSSYKEPDIAAIIERQTPKPKEESEPVEVTHE